MYNKVFLVGNLTRDIELRYTQGGLAIAKTGIATNRKYKKQTGEQVDEAMFIDITFFGRSGEIANQYLHKGSKVLIEGRLILEQWTDQNGQKRSKHSVTVDEMKMLDSRAETQSGAQSGARDYAHGAGQQNGAQEAGGGAYRPPKPQPQSAYQPPKQSETAMPNNSMPEIEIDDDEIPF